MLVYNTTKPRRNCWVERADNGALVGFEVVNGTLAAHAIENARRFCRPHAPIVNSGTQHPAAMLAEAYGTPRFQRVPDGGKGSKLNNPPQWFVHGRVDVGLKKLVNKRTKKKFSGVEAEDSE